MINLGDYVTRKSHNNDIVFKITEINENNCLLKGVEIRLIADAPLNDLVKINDKRIDSDDSFAEKVINGRELYRNDFFYMPGKILHIDGDKDYLKKCMDFYKKANVLAYGKSDAEAQMSKKIINYLEEIKPDILVITGHDAYYGRKKESEYKNSKNFIDAVRNARKYEKSSENLIVIAGACQSDYENLIKAGSTYASSPKRINIHALDPAIIAVSMSLLDKTKEVDLIDILSKTKYGSDGIGGIKSTGTMYMGYPRNEKK